MWRAFRGRRSESILEPGIPPLVFFHLGIGHQRELFDDSSGSKGGVSRSPLATHRFAHDRFGSQGKAGSVRGGDRLPWVPSDRPKADNFAPLASLDWQVHVYGKARTALAKKCRQLELPLHTFGWSRSAGRAGLAQDAAYLVRPDGYVGLADAAARPDHLQRYLDAHAIRMAQNSAVLTDAYG